MKMKTFLLLMLFLFGITTVKAIPDNAVAEIDGSYYNTISSAINAVPENTLTTIKLLKDRSENFTIPKQKNIILDLNSKTLSNNGNKSTVITNNGTLEIKNGTVTSNASSGIINNNSGATLSVNDGSYIATGTRQVFYNNGGTLNISGSAYIESDTSERASVHNLNKGILTISGGTIIANNSYAVYNDKGTLDIGVKDDEYVKTTPVIQGKTYGVIANYNINIYDGIIKGATYHIGKANSNSAPTTEYDTNETKVEGIEEFSEKVLGEEEIGGITYKTFTYNLDTSSIAKIIFNPNGGEVSKKSKKIRIGDSIGTLPIPTRLDHNFDGWFTESIGGEEVSESTKPSGNVTYYAHWTYVDPNTVAYVEGIGLMSLEDAVLTGGKIRLEKDVVVPSTLVMNKEAILDLNGHTMSFDNNYLSIKEKVTITDSSEGAKGKITSKNTFTVVVGSETTQTNGELIHKGGTIEGAGTYGAVRNYEKFELDGGTVTCTKSANGYAVYSEKEFVMKSGNVYSKDGRCIQVYQNSTFTMDGGLVKTDVQNEQAVNLYGDCSATINGGTIEGLNTNTAGLVMFNNTNLVVNGGTIKGYDMGIAGNGSRKNANITINDGTIIATSGVGMYLPQMESTTIINGGSISGPTGIEIRAGRLIVNGGNITGTSDEYIVDENGSGTTTKGAAIAVSQHNTQQPIEVIIYGGNLKSSVPLCNVNPMNNPPEATEKISIEVVEGNIESTGNTSVEVEDSVPQDPFITGGTYTNDPSTYVKDGYAAVKLAEDKYVVTKTYKVTVDSNNIEDVIIEKEEYPYQAIVEFKLNKKENYQAVVEVRDENGNLIQVKNNKFTMPESNVTIKVLHNEIMNPKTGDNVNGYFIMFGISIVGLIGIRIISKKKIFE